MRSARVGLAIAGGGLLVGLVYLASAVRGSRDAQPSSGPGGARQVSEELVDAGAPSEARAAGERASIAPPSEPPPVEPAPAARARPVATLDVTVVDAEGEIVPDVALELAAALPPHPEGYPLAPAASMRRTATSDAAGRARFDGLDSGTYELEGVAPDGRWARRTFGVHPGRVLELTLADAIRARHLVVRVLGTDGRAVEGAVVELAGARMGSTEGVTPEQEADLAATSDAEGRARFAGTFSRALLLATAPDGRVGWANYAGSRAPKGELELVVERPGALEGRLAGLPSALLPRARMRAYALTNPSPYYTTLQRAFDAPVVEGRYRFDALPAGKWTLGLDDPDGARLVLGRMSWGSEAYENSLAPIVVEVRAGATSVQDLVVARGATLEGRVHTRDGPVAGAEVRTTFAPVTGNFPDGFRVLGVNVWRYDAAYVGEHPITHPRSSTDAEGRYRLTGLPPGKLRVEVLAAGLSYDRREDVELADGETAHLEHELEPAGAIEGVEPNTGYLGVRKLGEERPRMIAVLPGDGRFAFPGLEAGRWRLESVHSTAGIEPVPLLEVEVIAGETTWVDLGAVERPVRLAGRVLDARGAVAGASVRLYPTRAVTDSEGRFLFWRSFPPKNNGWRGPALEVTHGGLVSAFELLPRAPGGWEGDVLLGTETLPVSAFDTRGAAAAVRLELTMEFEPAGESPDELTRQSIHGRVPVDGARTIEGLAPGLCQLAATFENGCVLETTVELPVREPVVLRAPPSGDLELTLRLADGSVPGEVRVNVWTWTGAGPPPEDVDAFAEGSALRYAAADESGRVTLKGILAGEIQLHASSNSYWAVTNLRSEMRRLRLEPGETKELELVLEPDEPR